MAGPYSVHAPFRVNFSRSVIATETLAHRKDTLRRRTSPPVIRHLSTSRAEVAEERHRKVMERIKKTEKQRKESSGNE